MFIFWNGNSGENSKVYEIAANMGGKYKFMVMNPSNFDVELRVNGPSGPTLGFAPAGLATSMIYTSSLEAIVFPVFQRVDTTREIVETFVPMVAGPVGDMPFRTSMNFENETGIQTLNLQTVIGSIGKRSAGASYINIINATESVVGNIAFARSNVIQLTPTGTRYFSDSREFRIDMTKAGDAYTASRTMGGLSIETGGLFYDIVTFEDAARTFEIKADKIYSVIVTGDFATLKAQIEVRDDATSNAPVDMTYSALGW